VAEVVVTGGLVRQCQVIVSPDRMAAYALTISELVSAVAKALGDDTARPGKRETLVVGGEMSVENLGEIVLASRAARPIRLKDVAQVRLGAVPPHRDPSRPKGEAKIPPAVLLGVLRQPGAEARGLLGLLTRRESDAKRLGREIDLALDSLRPALPADFSLARQVPPELAPLASQMAEEIQQDQPPEVTLRQETSADLGTMLVRQSPPRTMIAIVGPDIEQLRSVGRDLAERLRKVPGVADVQVDSLEEAPQTRVNVDREQASRFGVAVSDILATVEVAQEGRRVGRLEQSGAGRAFDVVVSFGRDMRHDAESMKRLPLKTATGATIPLMQLTQVEMVSVPRSLYRQQMMRAILISCEVRAGDRARAMAEIERAVDTYPLQAAYHWRWN
ncbi:MAG: hypothetical protein FJ276_36265, partial [Planctomycetes bacterium]|nr:hypothetical protein [Planctomycetota bacterium]